MNVRTFQLTAEDWTDLKLPVGCSRFVIEQADGKAFAYRSHEAYDSVRNIPAGCGIEIHGNDTGGRAYFLSGEVIGQVKGGQIVVSIGQSLALRITA